MFLILSLVLYFIKFFGLFYSGNETETNLLLACYFDAPPFALAIFFIAFIIIDGLKSWHSTMMSFAGENTSQVVYQIDRR